MSVTRVPDALRQRVATIAAMTAIAAPTNGMSVQVTDVNRGGLFVFDTSATAAADNIVTYDPDDGTTGAWVRQTVAQQWRLVPRPSAVTATPGAAGVLNGTYFWSVSFVTSEGETDVSIGQSAAPASQSVTVTIPVSSDSRVTARRIYRTVAGSTESQNAFFVGEVANNTDTSFIDNVADGSLGVAAPHINTSCGKILNGSQVIGAVSALGVTFGINAMPDGRGYACTAIGAFALKGNAGGYRNTAVGTNALDANTTGFNNTGVGVHALDENTTGDNNTAIGLNALFNLDGSQGCTAVGSNAGANITAGNFNTFIGYAAGQLKTGGAGNTYVGYQSGYAAGSGTQNAALGQNALQDITSGNFNLGIGFASAADLTTGNTNVALGWSALQFCQTGSGNIAIGPRAGQHETASNHLWIDNQNRSDLADAKAKALVYGEMGLARANQKIDFNGQVNPLAGLGMPGRTISADDTVLVDDTVIACNKPGATLTLTLPTGKPDKILIIRNWQAQTVVSASANVLPLGGGADGTAILPATVGAWAMLRCRASGTAWEIIMASS